MTGYQGAQRHYLSARRRDPVKVLLEEVVSHRMLAAAVRRLNLRAGSRLRVLDLGSGTGDGVALLSDAHGGLPPVASNHDLRYLGLDVDAGMVDTARALHPAPHLRFTVGDMRDELPREDFDLYLSCGVPYSHLTTTQACAVVTAVLRQVARTRRRAVLIVDVLGRYSIEWAPRWDSTRWNYAMSFFEDVPEPIEETMTFYDRASLGALIDTAARGAGIEPVEVTYTDRSVLVGRHTATRSFNPAIPPYRTLVNELARGTTTVTTDRLRFTAPTTGAPQPVLDFFRTWGERWNDLLERPGRTGTLPPGAARELATALLEHETLAAGRGLGTGHSLTATVVVDAAPGTARTVCPGAA